ncbi:Protein HID1 [Merluccius polli]|uniref:Protein HID1 n=1 Tax=Merluccius polli TaxID=89951 RepID=A0AA47N0T4_MERPO|nr:Protein HID1 [Merluccius polli]
MVVCLQPVEATDDAFWDQFWADTTTTVQDVFALVPAAEIRAVREESPSNLATLCYKVHTHTQHWHGGCFEIQHFFEGLLPWPWRNWCRGPSLAAPRERETDGVELHPYPDPHPSLHLRGPGLERILLVHCTWCPGGAGTDELEDDESARPLAESLLLAVADLLFCPDFTVHSHKRGPDSVEDMQSIDSCEYIWEAGVGFAQSPPLNYIHDLNRTELLRLLLTCFSEAMYLPPSSDNSVLNPWVTFFCSTENRHALPLFTSLLNVVFAYDPVGYGIPYNHLLFSDYREQLVEQAVQMLIVTLEHEGGMARRPVSPSSIEEQEVRSDIRGAPERRRQRSLFHNQFISTGPDNLFVNYLSRIHREEDYDFILKGLARLLTNPLTQTYLPNSTKKIQFHQELLVLFWKLCDFNKRRVGHPGSYSLLPKRREGLTSVSRVGTSTPRVGLMHIGVFILLLLSGERNFGVRLNKPYSVHVPMDIPVFTGTHADLLIVVFHKIITCGHQRLQPLYDCLLTIIVNVSPYLKSLSMVAANKLLHLLEAFSTSWFLFSASQNHHLIFFLLEAFNNIIQYQFDGYCNLVYAIIRKRNVWANLPSDPSSIQKALQRKKKSPDVILAHQLPGDGLHGGLAPRRPRRARHAEGQPGRNTRIEKLTEKSQVSEDGTMVSVPKMDSPHQPHAADQSAITGTSDTESNSGRDNELETTFDDKSLSVSITRQDVFYTEAEMERRRLSSASSISYWAPTPEWVLSWKCKLPLQTIMRLLQVLVPQVEKICIDKGLTDESEILKFLQHGTLVGLLPVPHPILIRKYQANAGTAMWFRTYMWGVVYLRNVDPPIWYDTDVRLFEIQRM